MLASLFYGRSASDEYRWQVNTCRPSVLKPERLDAASAPSGPFGGPLLRPLSRANQPLPVRLPERFRAGCAFGAPVGRSGVSPRGGYRLERQIIADRPARLQPTCLRPCYLAA